MKKLFPIAVLLTASIVGIADIAQAKGMPTFNATCPGKIEVHGDRGYVYLNGKAATVKKFNDNYYEAKGANITVSIAINPNETLEVSYTGTGRNHGVCTVKDD